MIKLAIFSGVLSPQQNNKSSVWTFLNPPLALLDGSSVHDTVSSADDGLLSWNGLLWGVPKKRTSHSKKRMRMTHKYLKPKHHYTVCPNCNNLKLLHVLCGHCLKETMRETASMRLAEIEQRLESKQAKQNSTSTS